MRTSSTFLAAALLILTLPLSSAQAASVTCTPGTWDIQATPEFDSQLEMFGVAAVGPSDVWAVGAHFPTSPDYVYTPLALHFDGSTWSEVPIPLPDGYSSAMLRAVGGKLPIGRVDCRDQVRGQCPRPGADVRVVRPLGRHVLERRPGATGVRGSTAPRCGRAISLGRVVGRCPGGSGPEPSRSNHPEDVDGALGRRVVVRRAQPESRCRQRELPLGRLWVLLRQRMDAGTVDDRLGLRQLDPAMGWGFLASNRASIRQLPDPRRRHDQLLEPRSSVFHERVVRGLLRADCVEPPSCPQAMERLFLGRHRRPGERATDRHHSVLGARHLDARHEHVLDQFLRAALGWHDGGGVPERSHAGSV